MDRAAFRDGIKDIIPAIPPNAPYGMLFGAAAVDVGLDPAQATMLSLFTFAATAQVATVELIGEETALPVVLGTVFIINLRYVVYSASLATQVNHLSMRWRAVIAYPLFDITYALAAARFQEEDKENETEKGIDSRNLKQDDGDQREALSYRPTRETDHDREHRTAIRSETSASMGHHGWYYLGTALPFVFVFTVSTLAGALIGRTWGDGLNIDFAIPLIFIALLVPTLEKRASIVSGIVAAAIAVLSTDLPFNTGLLLGLLCGTIAGALTSRTDSLEWSL